MSCSWISLPDGVWENIMARVPLDGRMRDVALACSKLNRVAASVQKALELWRMNAARGSSFDKWLSAHGQNQHLTSMLFHTDDHPPHEEQLLVQFSEDWPLLQELHVSNLQVVWGMEATLLPSAPRLTSLSLSYITSKEDSLATLGAATGLQRLDLDCVITPQRTPLFLAPPVLQKLTKLTHLSLSVDPRSSANDLTGDVSLSSLLHISCLLNLQELVITSGADQEYPIDSTTTPNFSSLTALTSIILKRGRMEPGVLTASTQLRHISLWDVVLEQPDEATAAATLLSCISKMPDLQHLQLCPWQLEWPMEASVYTALTHSSALSELQLAASENGLPPKGMWAAMFPAGRTWPNLKVLRCPVVAHPGHRVQVNQPLPASAPTAVELQRLVSCCPSLQECDLRVCDDVDLSPLAALTGLTSLRLAVPTMDTFRSLAQLLRLKQLTIDVRSELPTWMLEELTVLQSLESITVSAPVDFGYEVHSAFNFTFSSRSKGRLGRLGPVWLQLQHHCAEFPDCHPALLQSLLKTVDDQSLGMEQLQQQQLAGGCEAEAQQQQQAQRLQQQLEQQVAQLQQQGQEQGQELSAARSDAAAARSQAAELCGRVQALEAQLAQVLQAIQGSKG